ncbi:MAG: amino acid permease [Chitinophagales bacterium]|jgi:APA family basic amino acid/polyamine antiporter|nr:amino acid permease [Sphingobacteriales bacterium]
MRKIFRKKSIQGIIESHNLLEDGDKLHKNLSVVDLTSFGIAAVIGAGIFSTVGKACFSGGPGVIFLFIFAAIASGFTAMCYAEFASRIPAAGSAYTYAYTTFGEVFAWIIGWALVMEYSIGNIAVAISWSEYFQTLLENLGLHLPDWLGIDYPTAKRAFAEGLSNKYAAAYANAPNLWGLKFIINLPAFVINILITAVVYVGIKESKNFSNFMVLLKVVVIILVITVGFFYVDGANWNPLMPNGFRGVMAGVSSVFFAYIGFDAISTTAEECRNPRSDLPKGMFYALVICTILYILLALVLTGMVSYSLLDVKDPLAFVFFEKGLHWIGGVVSVSAIVAMTSVLLVFQMGQPRIWMSMSRDGLMPKKFSKIHKKYKTPSYATIITGLVVGIPILFVDYNWVIDFTSISTLFAFVLVCGGVLLLPEEPKDKSKFSLPKIGSRFPLLALLVGLIVWGLWHEEGSRYFSSLVQMLPDDKTFSLLGVSFFQYADNNVNNIALLIFYGLLIVFTGLAVVKNFTLIPVLGLLSCAYLLTSMTILNWMYFLIWMLIGLVVYFLYSHKNSKLHV